MNKKKKPFNPFYILLVLVGILFCITASAYGVMTLRGIQASTASEASASGQQLMEWIDRNGFWLMMIEIGVLAICTFAAIATDEYWTQQEEKPNHESEPLRSR